MRAPYHSAGRRERRPGSVRSSTLRRSRRALRLPRPITRSREPCRPSPRRRSRMPDLRDGHPETRATPGPDTQRYDSRRHDPRAPTTSLLTERGFDPAQWRVASRFPIRASCTTPPGAVGASLDVLPRRRRAGSHRGAQVVQLAVDLELCGKGSGTCSLSRLRRLICLAGVSLRGGRGCSAAPRRPSRGTPLPATRRSRRAWRPPCGRRRRRSTPCPAARRPAGRVRPLR
jgi:hypothetical protein